MCCSVSGVSAWIWNGRRVRATGEPRIRVRRRAARLSSDSHGAGDQGEQWARRVCLAREVGRWPTADASAGRFFDLDPADDVDRILPGRLLESGVHQRVGHVCAGADRNLDDGKLAGVIVVATPVVGVPLDFDGRTGGKSSWRRHGIGRSSQQRAAQGVRGRPRDVQLDGRVLAHPAGAHGKLDLVTPPDDDLLGAEPAVAAACCGAWVSGQFTSCVRGRPVREVELDLHVALRVSAPFLVTHDQKWRRVVGPG